MGPGLFRDEPRGDREPVDQGGGGFRIDPADRPFATSEPERGADSWNVGDYSGFRVGFTRLVLALIFMAVAAGGLWMAYSKGKSAIAGGGVPLIKADQAAMKSKPDNPGGVSEDGDTPVYSVNAGNGAKVEQLLPGPEQPLPKPAPAPVPVAPPVVAASPPMPGPVASTTAGPANGVIPASPTAPTAAVPSPAPGAAAPVTAPGQKTLAPVAAPQTDDQQAVAEAPNPAVSPLPPPSPKPKPAVGVPATKAPKQVAAAGGGTLRIQIAATKDIGSAHKEWARLKAAHMDVLGDLKAFGVRVDLGDRGIFYRIQAGPIDTRADAVKRCAVLKESGIGCIIVKQP